MSNEINQITNTESTNEKLNFEPFRNKVIAIPIQVTEHLSEQQKNSLWDIVRTLYNNDIRLRISYDDWSNWKF